MAQVPQYVQANFQPYLQSLGGHIHDTLSNVSKKISDKYQNKVNYQDIQNVYKGIKNNINVYGEDVCTPEELNSFKKQLTSPDTAEMFKSNPAAYLEILGNEFGNILKEIKAKKEELGQKQQQSAIGEEVRTSLYGGGEGTEPQQPAVVSQPQLSEDEKRKQATTYAGEFGGAWGDEPPAQPQQPQTQAIGPAPVTGEAQNLREAVKRMPTWISQEQLESNPDYQAYVAELKSKIENERLGLRKKIHERMTKSMDLGWANHMLAQKRYEGSEARQAANDWSTKHKDAGSAEYDVDMMEAKIIRLERELVNLNKQVQDDSLYPEDKEAINKKIDKIKADLEQAQEEHSAKFRAMNKAQQAEEDARAIFQNILRDPDILSDLKKAQKTVLSPSSPGVEPSQQKQRKPLTSYYK